MLWSNGDQLQPRIIRELLAELDPVIALIILADSGRVKAPRFAARHIEGINPIDAVGADVGHGRIRQPIQEVLEHRAELVIPSRRRAHRVVGVAVFGVGSQPCAEGEVVHRRVPEIRVHQPVIVPQFVRGDSHTGALQPNSLAVHIGQAGPAAEVRPRDRGETSDVERVIGGVIPSEAGGGTRVVEQRPDAGSAVPGLDLGQRQ